jgi:hypothetical protein
MIYLFAKNSEPLPDDPTLYREGTAYWLQYDDAYVASGVGAMSFLESATFNKYMNDLCVTLQKYLDYGVSFGDLPLFAPTDEDNPPQENDISRVANDIVSFQIFQNGKWGAIGVEATKETVGYIDFSKCFDRNILDFINESDFENAGKIRIGNCVFWDDFLKKPSSETTLEIVPEQQDNNDCGNSYFLGTGQIAIDAEQSHFFVKRIFGSNNIVLQIGESIYNMKDLYNNSAYVMEDGTICG